MSIDTTYASDYNEAGFWAKLANFALAAGRDLVDLALQLYYALQSPATPVWAKAVIVAALGYFISPIDVVPDFLPVVGYADDLGVLVAAVGTVATYITPEIKAEAAETLGRWFD
jgi:uncharacterized membrane protein YkvA (DUF1232 family)